ncbi:hypothetical protein [Lentilactobacillus kosonis]|uniref:Uncharacterized protein n=1 Tax=Lentilactobacillus kosonis TaxID=2810561 RepID=A0A401FIT0_9LACO|nr:hypothetical protein [Lentilactobacillus kosonis]GAY72290.1 hypothetical protein NBRC111893_436 [Lentilactobacillus kosonis]
MFLDNRLIIAGELSQYLNQDTLTDLVGRIKQITAFPDEDPYLSVGIAVSNQSQLELLFQRLIII